MVTRQEFLLEQIALRRKLKIESISTENPPDVIAHDGMVCSFVYGRRGEFIMFVALDGHPLLSGTILEVEEAFENGYTVKERENG